MFLISGHKNGKETESALSCKAMSFILHFSQSCCSSESVVVDICCGVGEHLFRYRPTGQIGQHVGYRMLSMDAAHRYSRNVKQIYNNILFIFLLFVVLGFIKR